MPAFMTVSSLLRSLSSTLRRKTEAFVTERWYGRIGLLWLLWPLEWLYGTFADRRANTKRAPDNSKRAYPSLPTIVVGNIVAGGTGKTPLVVHVVALLRERGLRPGIVTRGYGGSASNWPRLVTATSSPEVCGDEAVELAQIANCPVVAGPDRKAAVDWLQQFFDCEVAVSDDGLQHYAMARDLEFLLVDSERRFGNGHRLPVGPLREGPARLASVDLILLTGRADADFQSAKAQVSDLIGGELSDQTSPPPVVSVELRPSYARALFGDQLLPIDKAPFTGKACVALSGIGSPLRFHADLRDLGCEIEPHEQGDHADYRSLVESGQLDRWASAGWVVTTGKDAVKLRDALRARIGFDSSAKSDSSVDLANAYGQVWVVERQVEMAAADQAVFENLLASFVDRLPLSNQQRPTTQDEHVAEKQSLTKEEPR